MVDDNDHEACVNAWMERVSKGLPPKGLIPVFEEGFAAMWRRAHRTLGDATLTAILNRVLHNAAEQIPFLSALKAETDGLRCHELHKSAESLQQEQLAEGLRFVLVEFLTVLGNLTAEVLTPALHKELSSVAPEKQEIDPTTKASTDESSKPETSKPESKTGEGSPS